MTYLITVFLAWFSWDSVMFATPAVPQVVHGTLDLSQWNGQDVIDLTGVWFSAEDQLLDGSTAKSKDCDLLRKIKPPN